MGYHISREPEKVTPEKFLKRVVKSVVGGLAPRPQKVSRAQKDYGQRAAAYRQVDAAIFVCTAWLTFNTQTERRRWAEQILHMQEPNLTVSPQAVIETIVGFTGKHINLRVNMKELLEQLMAESNLLISDYEIQFHQIRCENPAMEVWAITAVHTPN